MPTWTYRGHDALWGWFELSYASFLTLPRVLMHEMPDKWQAKMATLLREYDDTFQRFADLDSRVSAVGRNGKFCAFPSWLLDYRHPDHEKINAMRRSK